MLEPVDSRPIRLCLFADWPISTNCKLNVYTLGTEEIGKLEGSLTIPAVCWVGANGRNKKYFLRLRHPFTIGYQVSNTGEAALQIVERGSSLVLPLRRKSPRWTTEVKVAGVRHFVGLAISLGWQDVKDTYQRSTLGPLWITVGLGVQIATIGLVFGLIFEADAFEYLPFLGISLVLWTYIVSTITDSTNAFTQSQQLIKQVDVPSYLPIIRVFSKNSVIFAHNFSIVALIMVVFSRKPGLELLLLIPGLLVVAWVMIAVSTIAGIVSARYRDLSPIISSILMVSFYVTPIIWMPSDLPKQFREPILAFNPFFHLMDLIRGPLLGSVPSLTSWLVGLGILTIFSGLALLITRRYAWKIVYWL